MQSSKLPSYKEDMANQLPTSDNEIPISCKYQRMQIQGIMENS